MDVTYVSYRTHQHDNNIKEIIIHKILQYGKKMCLHPFKSLPDVYLHARHELISEYMSNIVVLNFVLFSNLFVLLCMVCARKTPEYECI